MAVREYGPRSNRWRLGGLGFGPFDGGLNLRDAFLACPPNELQDGKNFTLDERGTLTKRNACTDSNYFPAPPGTVTSAFYSTAISLGIIQVGTSIYKCAVGGGSWTSFRTASTSAVVQFVDFAGKLLYLHPADGLRSYDGTTDSLADNSIIGGTALAVWQNKVWQAGYTAAGSTPRIYWSNAGNAGVWTVSIDFIDVREKDDRPIKALFASSGLLAFKEDSTYRINDSTSGSYTTIDWQAGCVGARAITSTNEGIFFWGKDGLYRSNGISPAVNVGDKLRPIYSNTQVNSTTKPKISAATLNGRVYFIFPRVDSAVCDEIIEYNPRVGWMMEFDPGGSALGPFFSYPDTTGIARVSFSYSTNLIKDLLTGFTLTGFSCSLQTGWSEPFGGLPARIERFKAQLLPPASTTLPLLINYFTDNTTSSSGSTWTGTATFTNSGLQVPTFRPKILGRAFQVQLTDVGSPLNNLRLYSFTFDALLQAIR